MNLKAIRKYLNFKLIDCLPRLNTKSKLIKYQHRHDFYTQNLYKWPKEQPKQQTSN